MQPHPIPCPFQASFQASPTNPSFAPVPTLSALSLSYRGQAHPGLSDPAHIYPRQQLSQAPPVSPRPAPSPPLSAPARPVHPAHPFPSHTRWGLRRLQRLLALPAVAFPALVQLPRRLPLRACLRKERREDPPDRHPLPDGVGQTPERDLEGGLFALPRVLGG